MKSRTSLDLELDLQASETRLQHLTGELDRLRQLKDVMQQAKARGTSGPHRLREPPVKSGKFHTNRDRDL